MLYQRINQHGNTAKKDQHPQQHDRPDRLDAQRRDAVHCKRQHLLQRILGFARESLMPLISHYSRLKSDHRHNSAQEQIDLFIFRQLIQRAAAHEAVVCMIENHFTSHKIDQFIKSFRSKTFKECIRFPRAADAVDDLAAFIIFFHKPVDHIYVILQVCVHGNHHIRIFLRRHQSAQKRVLVSPVSGQLDALIDRVALMQLPDNLPGTIPGTVIDKHDPAFPGDHLSLHQAFHLLSQSSGRLMQHLLLIVTGDYQV